MSRRKVPPAVPTDVLVLGCASVGKTMLIRQLHGTPRCFAWKSKLQLKTQLQALWYAPVQVNINTGINAVQL
jgi:hypothetical protein